MLIAPRQRRVIMMRPASLRAISCLLGLAAAGFGQRAVAAAAHVTIEFGRIAKNGGAGRTRAVELGRRPVIVVLHGGSGSGARVRRNLGLEETICSRNVTLVYPDAINGHWGETKETAQKDIDFLRTLLDRLVANGTADRRKIFLVGSSTGGMLALRIACEGACEAYAGVATVIANLPADIAESRQPPKPIPLMVINGTANPIMLYVEGLERRSPTPKWTSFPPTQPSLRLQRRMAVAMAAPRSPYRTWTGRTERAATLTGSTVAKRRSN